MILFLEWLCFDENIQVNGVKWYMDLTGVTIAALISKYSKPDDQKHIGQIFQVGYHLYPQQQQKLLKQQSKTLPTGEREREREREREISGK